MFLDAIKALDDMYNIIPSHLHSRYSIHIKEIICKRQMVVICPTTGKTTNTYLPITVHAVKD